MPPRSRMLALVGPWPRTAATCGSFTKASRIGTGSFALNRRSRSPTVSARRRRLPQTSDRITPSWLRIQSNIGATICLA